MLELKPGGVQTEAGIRRAAVKRVAENGKALRSGLGTDLMRFAGERAGLDPVAGRLKPRFRHRRPGVRRAADVLGPDPDERGANLKLPEGQGAISQEEILFEHPPLFELPGQGAIGGSGLAENDQPRSLLVQAVQEGQALPARFAPPEPFVKALAGEGGGRVGVPPGRFVRRQQVLIFEYNQFHPPRILRARMGKAGRAVKWRMLRLFRWPRGGPRRIIGAL
jgi:hypothetical protein